MGLACAGVSRGTPCETGHPKLAAGERGPCPSPYLCSHPLRERPVHSSPCGAPGGQELPPLSPSPSSQGGNCDDGVGQPTATVPTKGTNHKGSSPDLRPRLSTQTLTDTDSGH